MFRVWGNLLSGCSPGRPASEKGTFRNSDQSYTREKLRSSILPCLTCSHRGCCYVVGHRHEEQPVAPGGNQRAPCVKRDPCVASHTLFSSPKFDLALQKQNYNKKAYILPWRLPRRPWHWGYGWRFSFERGTPPRSWWSPLALVVGLLWFLRVSRRRSPPYFHSQPFLSVRPIHPQSCPSYRRQNPPSCRCPKVSLNFMFTTMKTIDNLRFLHLDVSMKTYLLRRAWVAWSAIKLLSAWATSTLAATTTWSVLALWSILDGTLVILEINLVFMTSY